MPVSIFGTSKSLLIQYLKSSLKEMNQNLLILKPTINENN